MKTYNVFKSGSTKIGQITATCITKAVKQFMATLDKSATYELYSRGQASITYTDNHTIMSNFVIIQL